MLKRFFLAFLLDGWGGAGLFVGWGERATLDSIVCSVNFSNIRPEFSGLPPAHSWIMYILLQKEESNLCIFYILYIGRYLSNWASEKNIYEISVIYVNRIL